MRLNSQWRRLGVQIRTVRSVLSTVFVNSAGRLDDASLRTFFYEAMAIVNNRPLTVDTISDPTSLEPLTPNYLITMKSSIPFLRQESLSRKTCMQKNGGEGSNICPSNFGTDGGRNVKYYFASAMACAKEMWMWVTS